MHNTLKKYWGYDSFRPLQEEIITSILQGHDTLGLLPTGGGKSITFQVPALMLGGITIVVTPLISLMKDQVDNLLANGIRAYCLHSGMSRPESRLALDRCRLGKTKILYVSPERLQSPAFIDEIRTWDVSLIVVDEAHCISQWGYDFRPSYLKIRIMRDLFPDAPVLALTASATPEVAEDIMRQLDFRTGAKKFAKSFTRPNISYIARYDEYKERALLRVLNGTTGSAIVYVRSRKKCRELAEMLNKSGIPASYYHAGLDAEDKEERQNEWKNGDVRVIVATNAFGMGIDKADVRAVVHYDLPSSLEEYYQEAGRAGRDGKPSFAVVIASKTDKMLLSKRLADSFPPKEYIAHVYEMAGNFLEVAVGAGYDQIFEFDFLNFCKVFRLMPTMALSALKILSQANYIEYVDEVQSKSRVMIIADKHELYSLNLDARSDRIFSELQRSYTGLFSDYAHIDENLIARRAEASAEDVYQTLLALSRMKVISYVPKKSTPYLYYATSREEPRHLILPTTVYEDRKARMKQRIDSMKTFVFNSDDCRVKTMLEYFGEKDAKPCGCCDVCRTQAKRAAKNCTESELEKAIIYMSSRPDGIMLEELFASLPATKDAAIDALRSLIDKCEIAIEGQRAKAKR